MIITSNSKLGIWILNEPTFEEMFQNLNNVHKDVNKDKKIKGRTKGCLNCKPVV